MAVYQVPGPTRTHQIRSTIERGLRAIMGTILHPNTIVAVTTSQFANGNRFIDALKILFTGKIQTSVECVGDVAFIVTAIDAAAASRLAAFLCSVTEIKTGGERASTTRGAHEQERRQHYFEAFFHGAASIVPMKDFFGTNRELT